MPSVNSSCHQHLRIELYRSLTTRLSKLGSAFIRNLDHSSLNPAISRLETRTLSTNASIHGWDEILHLPEHSTSPLPPLKPIPGPRHRPWSPIIHLRRTGKRMADQGLVMDLGSQRGIQGHREKMAERETRKRCRIQASRTTV